MNWPELWGWLAFHPCGFSFFTQNYCPPSSEILLLARGLEVVFFSAVSFAGVSFDAPVFFAAFLAGAFSSVTRSSSFLAAGFLAAAFFAAGFFSALTSGTSSAGAFLLQLQALLLLLFSSLTSSTFSSGFSAFFAAFAFSFFFSLRLFYFLLSAKDIFSAFIVKVKVSYLNFGWMY